MKTDRLTAALEMKQAGHVREIGPGRFIVRSQSKANKTYGVGVKHNSAYCACRDFEMRGVPCKHLYASVGVAALDAILQCRWATDLEHLEAVAAYYKPLVSGLPQAFINEAMKEYQAARERLSGQVLAKAA